MDHDAFENYLKERYEPQIAWYDKKAASNQRMYRTLQWGILVLSAITPVLVAVGKTDRLRWGAVVISALVAIGTAGLKAFKYQENWINYRTTCETLRKEIHFFHGRIGEYRDVPDAHAKFVERVEALVSRENTLWLSTQSQEEKST